MDMENNIEMKNRLSKIEDATEEVQLKLLGLIKGQLEQDSLDMEILNNLVDIYDTIIN